MNKKYSILIIALSIVIVPFSLAHKNDLEISQSEIAQNDEEIFKWLATMSEVCASVQEKPFRQPDIAQAFKKALKAFVSSIDAHSAFFPPESYKAAMESASGQFSGIGVSIISKAPEDDALVVIDVIDGGPAQKAGLISKDKIIEADGIKFKGLTTEEAITKIKGKRNTQVMLKIIREDKTPHEIVVTRDIIKDTSSLGFAFPDHNSYYFSLKTFAANSAQQMGKLLKKAQSNRCDGLILDLRRNPGGVLESAIDMLGLFLPKGSLVVTTKDKNLNVVKTYKTTKKPLFKKNIPLFLLIDNFSASASEIFAGCMRHYSEQITTNLQVFLVGTATFGKGSIQEIMPMGNGCALKLTTMLYYLPDDSTIQASGVLPDFLIKPKIIPEKELKWIHELYGKETTLKNHITRQEALTRNPKKIEKSSSDNHSKEKKEEDISWEEKHKQSLMKDSQVRACLNMIRLLACAQNSSSDNTKKRTKVLDFLKQNFITDAPINIVAIK